MKKMLSLLLCAVLLVSLTACGGSSKSSAMYSAGVRTEEAAAPEAPAMMADKAANLNSASRGCFFCLFLPSRIFII